MAQTPETAAASRTIATSRGPRAPTSALKEGGLPQHQHIGDNGFLLLYIYIRTYVAELIGFRVYQKHLTACLAPQ